METTMQSHTPMRPRTIAELLPGIKALLSKDALHMLTTQKHAPPNTCQTRTNEKNRNLKPMTLAEIRALAGPTPKRYTQPTTSTKSKPWNSSVKVDKTKPLTKDGRMKHSTVRKELNFQLKPKSAASNRTTMAAFGARKFIPPQATAQENATSRISGVYKIPETPVFNKPKPANALPQTVPTVKKNNISFKSNSDDSFVQREKEINDFEEKCNALTEEPTLENIAEISPPVSTPFKDYRNVRDYFNQSEAENSVLWNDNTILSFEKPLESKNSKREESVIVSLCEMLNKATVTNPNNNNLELDELIEVERQTENQLKMIKNVIEMMDIMKEKQLKNLQHIRNLIRQKAKENKMSLVHKENTTNMAIEKIATTAKEYIADNMANENKVKVENVTPEKSPVTSRATVIKSKSPSYKIPKKNLCLRKKVFCKSMPNVSDGLQTPIKRNDTALSMYLQIKEQMTFLKTPTAKPHSEIPDTPAITSHNLQKQLDKLYNN